MSIFTDDAPRALMETTLGLVKQLTDKLDRICNEQFESMEFKHLLSVPLRLKRA